MLEVQLGIPRRSQTTIGAIQAGTVFFGSLLPELAPEPHLRISGLGVVNLKTFKVIVNAKDTTPIYNYEEITDAILTRTSCCSLFDTLHPLANQRLSDPEDRA